MTQPEPPSKPGRPDPIRPPRSSAESKATFGIEIDPESVHLEQGLGEQFHRNRYPLSSALVSFIFHTLIFIGLALWIVSRPANQTISIIGKVEPAPNWEEDSRDLENVQIEEPMELFAPIPNQFEDLSTDELMESAASESLSLAQPEVVENSVEREPRVENGVAARAVDGGGWQGREAGNRARLAAQYGATEASEAAVEKGLRWLSVHQLSDGSWRLNHSARDNCDGQCGNPGLVESPNAATGLALLAYLGAGYTAQAGSYQSEVQAGINFLVRRQQSSGNLADLNMYAHGIATTALAEAYGMTGDPQLQKPVEKAVEFIVRSQHVRGGWRYYPGNPGDMTVTGWQLMALKSAELAGVEVPAKVWEKAGKFLDSISDSDGAYYTYLPPLRSRDPVIRLPSPTAIGLLMRMYQGWPRDTGVLDQGSEWLFNRGPSQNDIYFNYYSTQVLHHLRSPLWEEWNNELRDYLVATQAQQGHEEGSWFFEEKHGSQGGRVYTTALAIMTLEVYYRYLPLYAPQVIREDPDTASR